MTEPAAPLAPEAAARLAEFARACKAAARAVSLYPANHPAIGVSLGRLAEMTGRVTEGGPYRLQVHADFLLVDGAAPSRADASIAELADVLYRHQIGRLTLNAGADAASWRSLLLLLARAPEDVRADGGISHLWTTAGGPSIEIQQIDYAEVLREKHGHAATVEKVVAAALAGPQVELDDSTMQALVEIVSDPEQLNELMKELEAAAGEGAFDVRTAAFLSLLRGVADHVAKTSPEKLSDVLKHLSQAASRLSAGGMSSFLATRDRPEAVAGGVNVVSAVVDTMSDASVAHFVAGNVIAERGATERLAHAFQALVPEMDRRRQLLALAEEEVAASDIGHEENFTQLWDRVEGMMTSYSDSSYVSEDYARDLSSARTNPIEVERTSDDPPERVAAWLLTVNDAALRQLDHQLLLDLLAIETDPLRWRDVADAVGAHADDLVRVGVFDQAWQLAEGVVEQSQADPARQPHAAAVLERLARGAMLKHVAPHLRSADDRDYERVKRLCHGIGTPVIAPLAGVLSAEQDARSRRRLRDILLGFGARGRESVQQLMNAPNWEVRRTAAYLLREFGGSEGLKELVPLLTDPEPLVQREAIQGLVLNGSDEASAILLRALTTASGRTRGTLMGELLSLRDERAAPLFCYLLRHLDRNALQQLYLTAIEALGVFGGPDAVDALKHALYEGSWLTLFRTRRIRAACVEALRKIGTPAAVEALREASVRGSRGVRAAARTALGGLG
jgi:HEAT repeats/PBS lyase HEAT-like repeat